MSEGEEVAVEAAGKLGLFKAVAAFFKKAVKLGAEDGGKSVEKDLSGDLAKDAGHVPLITKELDSFYKNENLPEPNGSWTRGNGPVTYLDEAGRQKYLLESRDGKLYDSEGKLFDTTDASSVHQGGQGRAIYVMDENGKIYASKEQKVWQFHHSSFLSGGPVAGAGELVVEDGRPTLLTPRSGHYRPTPEMTQQVFNQLKQSGVDVSGLRIDLTF
jgi:hypothetical protein